MRNLAFLASPSTEQAARAFRQGFMNKTATWSVAVTVCASGDEAAASFEGRQHAFAVAPAFRRMAYARGTVKGASARLAEGADLLYRGGANPIALAQTARSVVDALEEAYLPLYGARVAVLGSATAALDMVYECSRAGVDEIVMVGKDKGQCAERLSSFLDEYAATRTQIIDTEQAREGHLSASSAYEHTEFRYAALSSFDLGRVDVVVNLLTDLPPAALSSLRASQIVCDPWGVCPDLTRAALDVGCDVLSSERAMQQWGADAAGLLVEFGRADL